MIFFSFTGVLTSGSRLTDLVQNIQATSRISKNKTCLCTYVYNLSLRWTLLKQSILVRDVYIVGVKVRKCINSYQTNLLSQYLLLQSRVLLLNSNTYHFLFPLSIAEWWLCRIGLNSFCLDFKDFIILLIFV